MVVTTTAMERLSILSSLIIVRTAHSLPRHVVSSHQKQKAQEISITRLDCKGVDANRSSLTVVSTSRPTEQGISAPDPGFVATIMQSILPRQSPVSWRG